MLSPFPILPNMDSLDLFLVANGAHRERKEGTEEVGGCEEPNYFGPRMPFSEGCGPTNLQGAFVPSGHTTPKALTLPIL